MRTLNFCWLVLALFFSFSMTAKAQTAPDIRNSTIVEIAPLAPSYEAEKEYAKRLIRKNENGEFENPTIEEWYQDFASGYDTGWYQEDGPKLSSNIDNCGFWQHPFKFVELEPVQINPDGVGEFYDVWEKYPLKIVSNAKHYNPELEHIANYVIIFKAFLSRNGYKPEVYDEAIVNYEKRRFEFKNRLTLEYPEEEAYYEGAMGEWLVQKLNEKVFDHQPEKRRFVWACEFGGGDAKLSAYKFTLSPTTAKAWLTTQREIEICKIRGYRGTNIRQKCGRWYRIRNGHVFELIGNYSYSIQWPNGKIERDTLSLKNGKWERLKKSSLNNDQ